MERFLDRINNWKVTLAVALFVAWSLLYSAVVFPTALQMGIDAYFEDRYGVKTYRNDGREIPREQDGYSE
jgi:hypothetical protein